MPRAFGLVSPSCYVLLCNDLGKTQPLDTVACVEYTCTVHLYRVFSTVLVHAPVCTGMQESLLLVISWRKEGQMDTLQVSDWAACNSRQICFNTFNLRNTDQ